MSIPGAFNPQESRPDAFLCDNPKCRNHCLVRLFLSKDW